MKGILFVGEAKGTCTRQLFTVARRDFMACLLQLHCRRYVIKTTHYCTCGLPLYFIVSRGKTYCNGHVCAVCTFEGLPGL
jgi:hypothetical protein